MDRSIPVSPSLSADVKNVHHGEHDTPLPAWAQVFFALAVLSLEEPGPISLTKLTARANVPPIAFLAQLKKLGNAGIVQFTASGRVLLTTMPNQSAIGVAQ